MQVKDTKYLVYAQGTMSQDGRMNALYQRKSGAPVYTTGAYADKFDENEANRRTQYKGKYTWVKYAVKDCSIIDYDLSTQEKKLTAYSLEYRNRMRSNPKDIKSILFEARNAYDNVVEDADNNIKATVKQHAARHWSDLQRFAEDLKRSARDSLVQSSSEKAFNENVATEIKSGKDPKQAVAIAYSVKHKNDNESIKENYNMKAADGINISVKLNGKKYKGVFNGISGADKKFGDVYVPDLVDLRSGSKGVYNPDEGNYVADGKFYFKMTNLLEWNPGLRSYFKDSRIKDATSYFQVDMTDNKGVTRSVIVKAATADEAVTKATAAYPQWKHTATHASTARFVPWAKQNGLYLDSIKKKDNNMKDAKSLVNAYKDNSGSVEDSDTYQVWTINEAGKYQKEAEVTNPTAAKAIAQKLKQSGKWVQISKNNKTDILNDSVKDADMFNITFERNGVYQSNLVKASSEEEAKQKFMSYAKKHNLPNAKIISVSPNKEGYKPGKPVIDGESIKDAPPVDVLGIVQSKRDNTGKTWYLLSISTKSGNKGYLVTGEYDGGFHHSGGGSVSFNLNTAKSDLDAFITIANLKAKYGEAEGHKRYMAGYKDSVNDGYNKFANTRDVRYLKEALAEMRRYERNWSGMKASEKRNIAPGGISELREDIRNAEAQLKKLGDSAIDSNIVNVIAKKALEMQDGCSRHYLEVEDCNGKRFYMITDEYDGCSRQFSGSGSVIEDKATLSKKYKDDLASGLTSVGRSAISGAKEVKSKIKQASYDSAVDLEMYKKPLDNLVQGGQVKDGVSASKVDAMLGINDIDTTKQLLKDAGINYSPVTSKVSEYKIVEGKCVKSDK